MAKEGSPGNVGERAMFAPEVAPFAKPANSPEAGPRTVVSAVAGVAVTLGDEKGPPRTPAMGQRPSAIQRTVSALPSRKSIGRAISRAVSLELDRGIAFLFSPVFLAAGALAYYSLADEPAVLPLIAGAAGLALFAFASRSRPALHMAVVAALLCILGVLLAKAETWRAGTKMLGGEITTQLTGRVAAIERMANGRVRLTIDVVGTARPVLRYAPERVRVSARRIPDDVTVGETVVGLVRLMPPSGPVRPGSYDFSLESYFDGIGASGFFLRGPERASAVGPIPALATFSASIERLRLSIAERISGHIGGPEGEIAAALVVGVRAGIPEEINEALRRSGIYHVISISGLHMALVAGTIMGLMRAGFALFPSFSSRHPVKKYAATVALVGLSGYLFMSGAEVAAQRSFIMLAVMLMAVLFDRAALTLRNLVISAIIVIVVSPHEVIGPSFQMSFAATAALVGAYAAWADWRSNRPSAHVAERTLLRRATRFSLAAIAGLAVTSIVAGGATAIYAAWHFQQMPSLGLFTNLTAMPVVSVIVMPFAVLGSLAMPFGLDGPFFQIMGFGLSVMLAIAQWFAERSPLDVVGLIRPEAVAVLTVALLAATVTSTWLRVAAIPVALASLFLLFDRQPDLLVSEDARLVGLDLGDGQIAINRPRPNQFTIDNWSRAMQAREIVRPVDGAVTGEGTNTSTAGFSCAESVCLARHPSGAIVALVLDAATAADHCTTAAFILIEDASAEDVCNWKDAVVVTSRDLARYGSAAVTFSGRGAPMIQYAIAKPYRPWHTQRAFSRAARGLPPYQPRTTPRAGEERAPVAGDSTPPVKPIPIEEPDAQ